VDIYRSARKHGVADADILHAVDHALGAAEQDDGKVLYLGADRAGNMLEVIAVERDDGRDRDSRHADAPTLRTTTP